MKVALSVILCLAISASNGFPASTENPEMIDFVPLEKQKPRYGDQPIVDTGIINSNNNGGLFDVPFNNIFQSLDGMLTRMRQQMNQLLGRLPLSNGTIVGEASLPGIAFPAIPDLDLGKGNTSSVTKIIDGHKVVINETEYKSDDENGASYFKIKIIDVKPDSSEVTKGTTNTGRAKDAESVENSYENEIPKQSEVTRSKDDLENFDEIDNRFAIADTAPFKFDRKWSNLEEFPEITGNRIDDVPTGSFKPIDLSQDTRINEILRNRHYPSNTDAETFNLDRFVDDNTPPSTFRPIDLSGDTRVNEILAKRNYPLNENAETFIVDRTNYPADLGQDVAVNNYMMNDQRYSAHPEDVEIFDNSIPKFQKYINPR